MELEVVIPTYNEETIIRRTLGKLDSRLKKIRGLNYTITVSDDGSTDSTVSLARSFGKKVKVLAHGKNMGRGEVLSDAFLRSRSDYVMFMDADLSTDLSAMTPLVHALGSGYDAVIGSRRIGSSRVSRPIFRKLISWLYHKTINLVFLSRIQDYQCGFKAFKRKKIVPLLKRMGRKKGRRWVWDAELMIRAERAGMKILEMPVNWEENRGRKSTTRLFRDGLECLVYLAELWPQIFFKSA